MKASLRWQYCVSEQVRKFESPSAVRPVFFLGCVLVAILADLPRAGTPEKTTGEKDSMLLMSMWDGEIIEK